MQSEQDAIIHSDESPWLLTLQFKCVSIQVGSVSQTAALFGNDGPPNTSLGSDFFKCNTAVYLSSCRKLDGVRSTHQRIVHTMQAELSLCCALSHPTPSSSVSLGPKQCCDKLSGPAGLPNGCLVYAGRSKWRNN